MDTQDTEFVADRMRTPIKWYLAVAACVVLAATAGVIAKATIWQGNAFDHELSFADETLSPETEVLFIGSSHTFQGVDPRLISAESANLGYGEANISICKLLLDQHLSNLPSLKLVVIQCESWSFELDSLTRQDYNYRTLLDQGVAIQDVPLPTLKQLEAFGKTMTGVDYPSVTPRQLLGRRLKQSQWTGVPGFRPPSVQHYTVPPDGNTDQTKQAEPLVSYEEQFEALVEIIKKCKERGVNVKLIRYPHTQKFEAKIETESWRKSIDRLVKSGLISTNDIWDFYNDAILVFDDEQDFADSNHLHPDAIPKFCRVINDLVEQAIEDKP